MPIFESAEQKKIAVEKFISSHDCVIQDEKYGEVNGIELICTLYLPKEKLPDPCKAIIYIHGGGYIGGARDHFNSHGAYFASKGIVGMCISYRLAPEFLFPAQIQDALCAIRWLYKNAIRLNVDSSQIYLCGASAGGSIGGVASYSKENDFEKTGGNQDFPKEVAGNIYFCGLHDFTKYDDLSETAQDRCHQYLGDNFQKLPAIYKQASCTTYIDEQSTPTLLLHGDADQTIPFHQSQIIKSKLESFHISTELIVEANGDHNGYDFGTSAFTTSLQQIEKFINK